MEQTKKALFRGVIDGVLDYLMSGYTYGYRAEHKDCFYCSIEAYKEDYTSSEIEDDCIVTVSFAYGFYSREVDSENPLTRNTNFSNKGSLDIYYPNIFTTKTPDQIHDIVYGMIIAHMQDCEE